jgi:hypothetical protein
MNNVYHSKEVGKMTLKMLFSALLAVILAFGVTGYSLAGDRDDDRDRDKFDRFEDKFEEDFEEDFFGDFFFDDDDFFEPEFRFNPFFGRGFFDD